jgi:hypothetical protein
MLALAANGTIEPAVADTAIVDLDSHDTSALMRTNLLHALSVTVGASHTPSGLLVVSRQPPPTKPSPRLPSQSEPASGTNFHQS